MNPLKKLDMLKTKTNLKNTFYEDIETQDTIIDFYLIQRNLISFLKRTIQFSFIRDKTFQKLFCSS